jgi:hypothetical protein
MNEHRVGLCVTLGFGLLALACQPNLGVPPGNRVPMADARVLGKEGQNVTVDYTGMGGAPIRITLDGQHSKDPDGTIKKYRWLSGRRAPGTGGAAGGAAAGSSGGAAGRPATTDADGGTDDMWVEQRWVPSGAPGDWPEDVMQPIVELGEGDYTFVLWVEDDRSVQSLPSTLKISVRAPLPPEVQACVDTVYDTVPSACKTCLCSIDDTCRMMSNESVCGAACWGFLQCLTSKCPDYRPGGDTSCLVANCSAQLSGATGATAIGPCVTQCPTQCRSTM